MKLVLLANAFILVILFSGVGADPIILQGGITVNKWEPGSTYSDMRSEERFKAIFTRRLDMRDKMNLESEGSLEIENLFEYRESQYFVYGIRIMNPVNAMRALNDHERFINIIDIEKLYRIQTMSILEI